MTQVDQFFMSPPDQFLMSFDTGRHADQYGGAPNDPPRR